MSDVIAEHTDEHGDFQLLDHDPGFLLTYSVYERMDSTVWFDHVEVGSEHFTLYRQGTTLVAQFNLRDELRYSSVLSALKAIESGELQ